MAERVHGQMDLGAALALGPVVPRPAAALGRGAQRAAVQHGGGRLRRPARRHPQHRPQVGSQRLEAARPQPAHRLLVDRRTGPQVVGHGPPRDAVAHHVAKPAEQLPQGVPPLPGAFGQQTEARGDKRPLLVGHVGGVRFAGDHARKLALPSVHDSLWVAARLRNIGRHLGGPYRRMRRRRAAAPEHAPLPRAGGPAHSGTMSLAHPADGPDKRLGLAAGPRRPAP